MTGQDGEVRPAEDATLRRFVLEVGVVVVTTEPRPRPAVAAPFAATVVIAALEVDAVRPLAAGT